MMPIFDVYPLRLLNLTLDIGAPRSRLLFELQNRF